MIDISPIKLQGEWDFGYALDLHIVSSEYIGDDEYGHPQYDTIRTEMGELLYQIKYKSNKSVLKLIIETAVSFIRNKYSDIDLIIPVPPSHTTRSFQPVLEISKKISNILDIRLCTDCIIKTKQTPQIKNIYDFDKRLELLKDAYSVVKSEVQNCNILLFDDLYRSGATLNSITNTLKQKGDVSSVNILALTMTRRKT